MLTISLLLSPAARAAIIAYDPFNQSVGGIDDTASSGGDPVATWPMGEDNTWTDESNKATIEQGSLSYGTLVTQGNQLAVNTSIHDTAPSRSFGEVIGKGSNLWISFLMKGSTANKNEGLLLSLKDANTGETNPVILIGQVARTSQTTPYYGIKDQRTTTAGSQVSPNATVDDQTHFFVVNLSIASDTSSKSSVTVYFDPDSSSLGGASPTGGSSTTVKLDWSLGGRELRFDQIRFVNEDSSTVFFDEFRMNTTWRDVSPTVPEPSSWVLSCLLLSLGIVFGWRRRRQSTQAA